MATSLHALKAAIAGGKALLVCGAGVSRAVAGDAAKGCKGLIESAIDAAANAPGDTWSVGCKAFLFSKDPDDWLSAADTAQRKLGGRTAGKYRAWLQESVGELKATEPALLDAIKALHCRLATTNYDSLLCDHIGVQPKTWRNPDAVAEILTGKTSHVWHIHGYWDDRKSVIFSSADYVRVGGSYRAQFLQHHAAFADTLIFIGCSADGLADENVGKLLDWFGKSWAGLGRNHFALVHESDMSAPGWPTAITRVSYGSEHDELPKFLRSLAPAPPPPPALVLPPAPALAPSPASGPAPDSVNSIGFIIPIPRTIGRENEIARVVFAALDRRPCIITGAPGMGKSEIAVAAAYDPRIEEVFGQRRVFVSLDHRSDPLDLFILLASELGLTTEPTHNSTLAAIRYACGLAPAFAILDNAEQLIDANEAQTGSYLGLLRDTTGLSFVVTSRQSLPGLIGWERTDDLPPLSLDDARALFCSIATSIQPNDPDLQPLLEALGNHALSLTILASRVDGGLSLKPMLKRWKHAKASLLSQPGVTEDRQSSVRASLRLSLTSRHMTPIASRLLSVLGFLPAGLLAGGLKAFLGHEDPQITEQESDNATDALRRLRLIAPREDGLLKLLNPIREAVIAERPLQNPDLERVLNAGLTLLEKGNHFGTDRWPAVRAELLPHIGNFAPILAVAGQSEPIAKVLRVIQPARLLALNDSRFEQAAFLELASVLSQRATADAIEAEAAARNAAGDLALRRDDLEGAKSELEKARDIYARTGSDLGEANARQSLGDLALQRDDLDGARIELEAAQKIYVRIGVSLGEANARKSLGNLALQRDDLDGAKKQLEAARDIYARTGSDLGEANARQSLGDLALQRDDLDGARIELEAAQKIYVRIGDSLGEANARKSLGDLALQRDDLDGAKKQLEAARDISVRIGDSLGEANALRSLGDLALRRDDLDGARIELEKARDIYARTGSGLGEANALRFLGYLALRRDDPDSAKKQLEAARVIYVRIGNSLGEANTAFLEALASTREDIGKAEAMFDDALKKYQALNDAWGIANNSLRLAQIAALRGDSASLPAAAAKVLAFETSHPSKRAGPGWRALCASLTETDSAKREALRDEARAAWTGIGVLGLVRDYLDFRMELKT
jgi:hypothetical protein